MNKKISFNLKSPEIKALFEEMIVASGKSKTAILNELVEAYVLEQSVHFAEDEIKNIVRKLLLLINSEDLNVAAIKREVNRLWLKVQS